MFKICLSAFIGASLVKFIKDAESTNELLLAFDFSFFRGYYIGNGIVSYFLYHKTNNKISLEIELIIKDYNDATEKTMKPFLIAILRVTKIVIAIRRCCPPLKQSVMTFIFGVIS